MEEKKIKVMHIIDKMNSGGAQRIVLNYLEDFQNDNEVDLKLFVLKSAGNSNWDKIIKEKKLNVKYLNMPASKIKIPYIKRWFNKKLAEKAWNKAISEYNPDIVHVHMAELLLSTLKPIVKSKIPIRFFTWHDDPANKKGRKQKLIRRAMKEENFIPIYITKQQVEIAKKYYEFENYEVVKNGIDIENIKSKIITKDKARALYNIPKDAYVIIGVGRLCQQKNFSLLIDAFNILIKQKPNALLIIAGKGAELEKLQTQIKRLGLNDKVRLIGNQDNIVPLYCAADVMGIPSIKEPCSLVLLESQVCGLRNVISSAVPDESIITDKVEKLKENATIQEWASALLNENYQGKAVCEMQENEVHSQSQKMKDIYIKYWKKYRNEI